MMWGRKEKGRERRERTQEEERKNQLRFGWTTFLEACFSKAGRQLVGQCEANTFSESRWAKSQIDPEGSVLPREYKIPGNDRHKRESIFCLANSPIFSLKRPFFQFSASSEPLSVALCCLATASSTASRGKILKSEKFPSQETIRMLRSAEARGGRGALVCDGNFLSPCILTGFRELYQRAGLSLPWTPRTSLRFYNRFSPPPCCPVFKKCPYHPDDPGIWNKIQRKSILKKRRGLSSVCVQWPGNSDIPEPSCTC